MYLGVKLVDAVSMTASEALLNNYKVGNAIDENKEDGYEVTYEDGYKSWSPKEVFDKAYRKTDNLTFGLAIEALKLGKRVARKGWNGKGMFLFILPAATVPTKVIYDSMLRTVIENEIGDETFEALASIRMFTADKKILTGWLASQTDILSEDWIILD